MIENIGNGCSPVLEDKKAHDDFFILRGDLYTKASVWLGLATVRAHVT